MFAIIVNPVVSPPLWLTSSNGSHQESGKFGALAVSYDLAFLLKPKILLMKILQCLGNFMRFSIYVYSTYQKLLLSPFSLRHTVSRRKLMHFVHNLAAIFIIVFLIDVVACFF